VPVLKNAIEREVTQLKNKLQNRKLLIGGRSLGGRAASMLAADGFACDGLLLAAYPLHPAGKPEKLRDAHLPAIRCPVLCFNGTRDALCRRDLMEAALTRVTASWTMHWLEGADHSFKVLKSSGRTEADVDAEVRDIAEQWLRS
jgi:predicted alpha/beta-hydrolase family hydrolase